MEVEGGHGRGRRAGHDIGATLRDRLTDASSFGIGFEGREWLLAVAIGLASPLYWCCSGGGLVPENWPLSPFALFPWSGPQWKELFRRFVASDTRLVLATAPVAHERGGTQGRWEEEENAEGGISARGCMEATTQFRQGHFETSTGARQCSESECSDECGDAPQHGPITHEPVEQLVVGKLILKHLQLR